MVWLLVAVSIVGLAGTARVAEAASGGGGSYVVNDLGSGADATPGDGACATSGGTCTLAAAVAETNAAPPGSSSDITFAVSGTIALSQPLVVSRGVVISGAGQHVVLDGGGTSQLFVFNGEGSTWGLGSLTLANGHLSNPYENGAAINSSTTGLVDGVTFTGNATAAGSGGAIAAWSTITVRNATFVGNSAATGGADLWSAGTATITNSTFVGSTGGPIAFTFNGSLDNSIVTGASGAFGCTIDSSSGGTVTGGHNLGNDTSCPGESVSSTLGLSALGDHGGDVSTVALAPDSAAIDAGDTATCAATDARGLSRPQLGGCDVGAVEYDPATTTTLAAAPATTMPGDAVALTATVASLHEAAAPAGTVTFSEGATTLGSVTLTGSGTATLNVSSLTLGNHTLTATYAGAARFTASSGTATHRVSPGALTVTLAAASPSSLVGDAVTLTATLLLPGPTPATGTVTFSDGATTLGSAPLTGTTATLDVSSLALGGHDLVATYSGDTNYDPAASAPLHHDVQAHVTITPTATPATVVYGNTVTISAHLSSPDTSAVPSGTVLVEYGSVVGTTTLDASGNISFSTAALPAGSDDVLVIYQGDATFAFTTTTVRVQVDAAATTTALAVAPLTQSAVGATVTLDAQVTATGTPLDPTGAVEYFDGLTSLGLAPLDASGGSTFTTTALTLGTHQLTAVFRPDAGFAASTSAAVAHEITTVGTTTALSAPTATSVWGETVTFTATVAAVGSAAIPAGQVELSVDGTPLATVVLDATGSASFPLSSMTVGDHTVVATYLGTPSTAPSTASPRTQHVVHASPVVTVAVTPGTATHGQTVHVAATVGVAAPGSGVPTGIVTFTDGTRSLGFATLDGSGSAAIDVPLLGAGSHTVTATYVGDGNVTAGNGSGGATVNPVASTLVLTSSAPSLPFGAARTLTATVTTATGVVPVGDVTFLDDDSAFVATVPLDATGVARVDVSALGVGLHNVRANFSSADVTFSTATTTVQVTQATPTVTIGLSTSTVTVGEPVTVTGTVTGSSAATPTGSVDFLVDGSVAATEFMTVAAPGTATATHTFVLPAGSRSLRIRYQGDISYVLAVSNASPVQVGRLTSSVTAAFAPTTLYTGQQATLGASVATIGGRGAPTGQVDFTLDGAPLGSVTLDGAGRASLASSALTVGSHTLAVAYDGDGTYGAGSATVTTTVTPPPTVLTITPSTSTPKVGQPVTYTLEVTNVVSDLPVAGNVWLRIDGSVQGLAGLTGAGPSRQATITAAMATPGPHTVSGEFIPANGTILGSTGAIAMTATRYSTRLAIDVATPTPVVGQPIDVHVVASVDDEAGAPTTPLSELITVSDGNGGTCTLNAPEGTCQLQWPTAGPRSLQATMGQTDLFTAAVSPIVGVQVGKSTPQIHATSSTDQWVAGDPVDIAWGLDGPTTGTVTVSTTGGHVWCTVPVAQQRCAGSFDASERAIGSVTVRFDGTADFNAAETTVTKPVLGCVRVLVGGSGRGDVDVTPAPNCNHGTGYVSYTALTLTAHPNPGFVFSGFTDPAVQHTGNTATYPVDLAGTGTPVMLQPRFDYACSALTITFSGPVSVGAFGDPACTQQASMDGPSRLVTWWRTGTDAAVRLTGESWFTGRDGSRQVSPVPAVAYWLDGAPAGTPLNLDSYRLAVPMPADTWMNIGFGRPCFVVSGSVAGGSGSVVADTATNCRNPYGRNGYVPDTAVSLHYAPAAHEVFSAWGVPRGLAANWVTDGAKASLTVRGDVTASAEVQACHQLRTAQVGFPEDGSFSVTTDANCGGDAGWYLAGTQVRVAWSSWYFAGWDGDQPTSVEVGRDAHAGAGWFTMDADKQATPIFRNNAMCSALTVATMPASGAGTASISGDSLHTDYPCPPGTYPTLTTLDRVPSACYARYVAQSAQTSDRGLLALLEQDYQACSATTPDYQPDRSTRRVHQQWVTLTATPSSNSLVGWTYDTQSPPWVDDPLQGAYDVDPLEKPRSDTGSLGATRDLDIYGKTTATAWFCEQLTGQVELVHPDGSKAYEVATPGSNYIAVSPAPNCPIAPNAWVVGTTVRVAPAANKAGYGFDHWYGGTTGTTATTEITLDGSRPSLAIGISYKLACYKLQVRGSGDVQRNPASNCHGAGDGNWYVGGTVVGLNAVDRGSDYTWNGWAGDVGTGDNPSWVVMNADKSVEPGWSEKSLIDKAGDWLSGAYHSVSDFMTHDVADYFSSMKDASLIMLATLCKGAQMAFQAFTSPSFGIVALPLNVLRLLNLALDNDDLASVIDEYATVLDAMDISNLLLGCAADSVLGLNQGPDNLSVEDAKSLAAVAGNAKKALDAKKAGNSKAFTDPEFGKVSQAVLVAKGVYTGYQIGTSIAEGNIATHGKELSDRYASCIDKMVPKRLASSLAGALG